MLLVIFDKGGEPFYVSLDSFSLARIDLMKAPLRLDMITKSASQDE